jgi:peptide deformylase
MAIRELRLYEDPDLQKVCRPVAEVSDHIRRLLDDLTETMRAFPGCVGLAANQVGILRRVAVLKNGGETVRLVNPVIVEENGLLETEEECICFKDIRGIMFRPKRVVVQALDDNGETQSYTFEDDAASLACHLIDHLDGKILVKHVAWFTNGPLEGE